MRRFSTVLAAVPLAAFAVLANAAPAQAASPLQFGRMQYDSPGSDTRTNTSLNAEYVVIRNLTTTTRCLTGWTVRDAAAHVYTFGTFCLGGGRSVYLHTGRGTNTSLHRYWNSGNYIWNNPGDRAWLRNGSGTQMDYCAWGSVGAGYLNC
jgi:hypothetical protein